MKIIVMYFKPELHNPGTKAEYSSIAEWEVFVDTEGNSTLPFGYITTKKFSARPTKRQIRAAKREHRKLIIKKIEEREWENSWEAIHCDIIGL